MTEIEKVEAWIANRVDMNKSMQEHHPHYMNERTRRKVSENINKIAKARKFLADKRVQHLVNNP